MAQEWVKEDITWGQDVTDRKGLLGHLGPYFLLAEIETEVVGFAYGSVHSSEGMAATKDLQSILRSYQRHAFRPWHVRMYR